MSPSITASKSAAGLALGASLILAVLGSERLPLVRLSTMNLSPGLPSVFMWTLDPVRKVCRLGDRGESASRRDDPSVEESDGTYRSFDIRTAGRPSTGWYIRCRDGGARLFVPVEAIPDWTMPVVHRASGPLRPDLPRFRWVHFHADRIYRGLHLRIDFSRPPRPDLPARDDRDELVFLTGSETLVTDRELRPLEPSRSRFLRGDLVLPLVPLDAASCRVLRSSPSGERVVLFDPAAGTMTALPFPLPLVDVIRRLHPASGSAPPCPELLTATGSTCESPDAASGVLAADVRRDLDHFERVFRAALRDHAELSGQSPGFSEEILARRRCLDAFEEAR